MAKKNKAKGLFDDDAEEDAGIDSGFKVNEDYAGRFEERKRKEELSALKGKKIEDDEDSYSSEDSDAELLTGDLDVEIMRTVTMLRNKDPRVYEKETKFYTKEDHSVRPSQQAKEAGDKKSKDKPQYLRDVVAKQLLEHGPELSDSDDEGDGEKKKKKRNERAASPSNIEKEAALKEAFKQAGGGREEKDAGSDDDSDGGGMFTLRNKTSAQQAAEEAEYEDWAAAERKRIEQLPVSEQQALRRYYEEDQLDENEQYLRDYILNQKWQDKTKDHIPTYQEIVDEDEADLDAADNFERRHNFRFEEAGSSMIIGHARQIEGSMRKKKETRKEARARKKERKAAEKKEKEEEIKRLKNLKKQEALSKLSQIVEASGAKDELPFTAEDLEADFDPDKWNEQMSALFNEDYYDQEDDDVKPVFTDSEDEGGDGSDEAEGKGSGIVKGDYVESSSDEEDGDDDDKGEVSARKSANSFRGQGRKLLSGEAVAKSKKEIRQKLEEFYKLDYEDLIGGDIQTRFQYTSVPAMDFGLEAGDVLAMDDKELTQHVPLQKLAPYAEQDEVQRWWKKEQKKRRYASNEGSYQGGGGQGEYYKKKDYKKKCKKEGKEGKLSKKERKKLKEQEKKEKKKDKKDVTEEDTGSRRDDTADTERDGDKLSKQERRRQKRERESGEDGGEGSAKKKDKEKSAARKKRRLEAFTNKR